jgi:hypothetical protein
MAPIARNTALRTMIRVSSTVSAWLDASNPGAMNRSTRAGAVTNTMTPRTARPMSMRSAMVDTSRHARRCSSFASSSARIGMRAEDSAPAATS